VRNGKEFFGRKKKRGGLRLLSRVEVSELRLRKTADLPRPFQLSPFSDPLPSAPGPRAFYTRLIYRRLLALRFDRLAPVLPSASGLAPFRLSGFFRLAPSQSDGPIRCLSSFQVLTFSSRSCFQSLGVPLLALLPAFEPCEAFASWRLSQGIASPFRVALLLVRPGVLQSPVRATHSVPRERFVLC
jgi:hypothetical protein